MPLSLIARLRARLGLLTGLADRREREARLAEEIDFHIEMQTKKNVDRGMSPGDAKRAAIIEFGGREPWREASRDEYRSRVLDDLAQDLRYALRTLRSSPGFAIAAVLTLALGIGGNTAIFSAVDGVLLKPLPFSHQEQVVSLFEVDRKKGERDDVSPANFNDWHNRATAFSGLAAAEPFGFVLSGNEGEEQVGNWNVTRDFFDVLDAKPVLGRLLQAQDFVGTGQPVIVLTYSSWQKRFGGSASIVGSTVSLNKQPVTIVGVLPRDFSYLQNSHYEMFSPKVLDESERRLRGAAFYHAVARLKPGMTLERANADMSRVAAQLAQEYPATNRDLTVQVLPLRDEIVGDSARALLLLLGAVGFVLLIACTNVANLMLTRTTRRAREFAIRAALGAGRGRIVRQILAESFIIAVVGGVAGVVLAYWGIGAIRGLSPSSLPRVDEMRVDERATMFALAAIIVTTFVFGLVPALRAAEPSSRDELKAGGRNLGGSVRQHRLRGALVTGEVALAVILLVGAGLLVRSFASVLRQDRGYKPDHVLSATLFAWQWNRTPAARREFFARLVDRASHLPGVSAAGATSSIPLAGEIGANKAAITIIGKPVTPGQEPQEHVTAITPGAFAALGMVTLRGRVFTSQDDSASVPVVVINQAMARRYWPNEDPIGRRVKFGFYAGPVEWQIVGVVADIRQSALDAPPDPILYMPHAQASSGAMSLVLRTQVDAASLGRDVKRLVNELNPEMPVAGIQTLDAVIDESLKPRRFTLVLFGCFAAAALVLAMIGVYGVISQSTAERVREFGLRIALGAQPGDIMRMVLRQGIVAAAAGVLLGLLGAALLTKLIANMLVAVEPLDLPTFAAVSATMLVTAAIACWLPARRATRVDPLISLRAG